MGEEGVGWLAIGRRTLAAASWPPAAGSRPADLPFVSLLNGLTKSWSKVLFCFVYGTLEDAHVTFFHICVLTFSFSFHNYFLSFYVLFITLENFRSVLPLTRSARRETTYRSCCSPCIADKRHQGQGQARRNSPHTWCYLCRTCYFILRLFRWHFFCTFLSFLRNFVHITILGGKARHSFDDERVIERKQHCSKRRNVPHKLNTQHEKQSDPCPKLTHSMGD